MTGFTSAEAASILLNIFNGAEIALLTGEPSDSATGFTGKEVSGNGYERVKAVMAVTTGSTKQIQNTEELHYPIARNNGWGTLTHWAAIKSGTMRFADTFKTAAGATSTVPVPGNSVCVWDIGELMIGLDKKTLDPANPTHT